ncbi:MAG: MBL fold metallo-hydrolase [Gemmatimonadetes bacterium]|nr:MBL fold metallo-hydrolase [Gemmatimonadota bacterium]
MRTAMWLALAATTLSACARPEVQIINDAAAALGGKDRIQAVKTLIMEGEGTNGNLGQNVRPDAELPIYNVTSFRRAIDVPTGRARLEQVRTPTFLTGNPAPQRQSLGVDGDIGYDVGADGTATRVSNRVTNDRRTEVLHHPLTLLRAAMDPAATLANPRTEGNLNLVDITTAAGQNLTLAIDATTKLPARVTSMSYNTNLGDVAIETSFGDYQDVNGLMLPRRLTTKVGRYTTADIRVSSNVVDGDVGDLAAPEAARATAEITSDPPANVTVEEVAKGIWYLAGQSHHSLLVEFSDHLLLIEAPQNETRTLAVIAKARELRPEKPLTHVVNTHHHFDHSGGMRAAVSEGLTVITHKLNAPFYQELVGQKHTIVPDALARNPKELKLQTVDGELVLKDSMMTVELHTIDGSPHAETLIMAYFPRERILVQADTYSPTAAAAPFAANLLENIRKRNLRVDRLAPIHGRIVPLNELVKAAQAMSSNE